MTRRGFTLLELLIALAVLAVVVSAVALTQVSTYRATRGSEGTSVAVQAASNELNRLRQSVLGPGATNYWTTCDGAASGCTGVFDGRGGVKGTYAIYGGANIPVGSLGGKAIESSEWPYSADGLVLIVVEVNQPSPVRFTTYVSCIDRTVAPTIADPATCPGFASGTGG